MSGSDKISDFVATYSSLLRRSLTAPTLEAQPLSSALLPQDKTRPVALLLSPHPDDECLTGLLPLRLKQEQNWRIINIALTLGSDDGRKEARKVELARACKVLGFDCLLADEKGFSDLLPQTQIKSPPLWQKMVRRLQEIINVYEPSVIFVPHRSDAHPTHIGAHLLAHDALASLPADFSSTIIETEYWQPLEDPNLMIGGCDKDVGALLSALTCHQGEVARNPYDLRFPSYLIDNVRRGSERLKGKGAGGADMDFAQLYRLGMWGKNRFMPSNLHRLIGVKESLKPLFE